MITKEITYVYYANRRRRYIKRFCYDEENGIVSGIVNLLDVKIRVPKGTPSSKAKKMLVNKANHLYANV